jgi:hypothetical protein
MALNNLNSATDKILHQLLCKRFGPIAHQSLVSYL